jgi:Tfp pilus assembly protein PilF
MNKLTILTILGAVLSINTLAAAQQAPSSGNFHIKVKTAKQIADFNEAYRLEELAEKALESAQYTTAESEARQSMALNRLSGVTEQILAAALNADGKAVEAAPIYATMFDSEKAEYPRVLLPYALLLLHQGNWAKALDVYNKALPHVGSFLFDGHDLLVDDNDFSVNNPRRVELETDIRIALGFTGIDDFGIPDTKDNSRAFAEYSEALRLSPDSPLANLAYAKGLMFQGRGVEARAAFRDAAQKYSGGYKISAEKELGIYVYPAVTAPAATSN